jgi:hypothetical protein
MRRRKKQHIELFVKWLPTRNNLIHNSPGSARILSQTILHLFIL